MNTTSVVRAARGLILLALCQALQPLFWITQQRWTTVTGTFSVAAGAVGMPIGPTYCTPAVAAARGVLVAWVEGCIKSRLTAMAIQRPALWMLAALAAGTPPGGMVVPAEHRAALVSARPIPLVLAVIRLRKMATT
ncbi:hypothetical protein CLA18_07320 [Pseudomonas protegens]|nr:hypothetical protein CLA18_07320 [Pseudomonas protegens]RLO25252.1 hypothetical protein EAG75_00245 [Pseudomonas protegens]